MKSAPSPAGVGALQDLRKARRKNRLADLDWFEAAYRVYLVAFAFGGAALWLSGFIKDDRVSAGTMADIFQHGPALLGMLAATTFAAGMRSGSRGGPLAVEEADVHHVLLSPVARRRALLRPAFQRARSAVFTGTIVGALAGMLAGRRLPGSDASWTFTGTAFGAGLGLLFMAAAFVAHALGVPRWLASLLGAALLAWQVGAIARGFPGPFNLHGSLALWGVRQRGIDLLAPLVTLGLAAIGFMLLERTSLDALARRSGLVAQLRFAVTMQDLRTVMLLRRQLSQENTRQKPWIRLRRSGGSAVIWRRGWHSLLRFPVSRVLRMLLLAVGAGASQVTAYRGTTAMFVVSGLLLFLLGMETLEPLSQEIDQPDRLAALPHNRGDILVRHTIVPLIVLIPFALVGLATVALIERTAGAVAVGAILALPTVWLGAAGAAVSIVKDAPDLTSAAVEQTMLPPEMSGLTTIVRGLIPLIVSVIGAIGVVLVRSAHEHGTSEIGAAVRIGVFQLMLIAFVGMWVRRRDEWKRKFKNMMAEGREQTAQQRSRQSTRSL